VIIGRLIPAGTGFNAYKKNDKNYSSDNIDTINRPHNKNNNFNNLIDDIILDDRSARKYHFSEKEIKTTDENLMI
jgi:DNA-directed RNA polymerase subunit beta'